MKPGDIVVCINDKFPPEQAIRIPNKPKQDRSYIIRKITYHQSKGLIGILLEEITNPLIPHPILGWIEPDFNIDRFRKIDDLPEIGEIMEEVEKHEVKKDELIRKYLEKY